MGEVPILSGLDIVSETPVKIPLSSCGADGAADDDDRAPLKIPLPSYGADSEGGNTLPVVRCRKDRKKKQEVAEQELAEWSYEGCDTMGLNAAAGVVFAPNFRGVPMPRVLSSPPGLAPPPGAPSHG